MKLSAALLAALAFNLMAGGLPFAHYGLLDTPTASLLRHTEVAIAGGATTYSLEDSSGSSNMDVSIAGYLEVGLFGRGQIGGTYLGQGGFSGTARGLALMETINRPGIAVGVENLIGEENYEFYRGDNDSLYQYPNAQNFSIYGVLTKDFSYFVSIPVCVNIGYGTGRFQQSSEAVDGLENPVPGLFGSVMFHPTMESEIMLEWDGRDLNIGGLYRINRNVTVMAAASELEHLFVSSDSTESVTDVMQTPKFSLGVQITVGPFLNRTELDPYERLRYTEDDEALRQMEEYREGAREEIDDLEDSIN
ncbi:MAG TPA: hypothetical protein PLM22_00965 [Candidatus Sabulitectum sp.]|nr:hypothetical protein [Candidatus Sabulitectum sp.]HPF31420.1 hypothetical protein [Candidatus Sabulitectum sp.]HPJ27471.1 hypothetical protein [Candidatus Sabulitectum sp.]HPR21304.1 hypothetical protein [Candidatus Sabulitectum sp.]